jgi:hypothetical protein
MCPADHLGEQFCSGLAEGDISQFIQAQQVKPLQLFLQPLQTYFLPAFH